MVVNNIENILRKSFLRYQTMFKSLKRMILMIFNNIIKQL